MSQQTVLQLLQELGGIATSSEIIRLATLWQYVGNRLRRLRKWGFVGYDAVSNKYFIVKEEQTAETITTCRTP
jgi:hypothetical protein